MKNSLQQPQRQSSIGILILFLTPYKVGAWPMANCRDLAFKFDELKVYLLLGTVFVLIIELLLI
jgi:hypothetical protein